ncbi:MAG: septation protein SpoVG family protein [Lachnospiraceae bacterium]|nr:septation protein SpoVG family protein [Lachnospiraceae bacterium]
MMKIYAKVFPYQPKEGSDSKVLGYATLELGGSLKVNDVVIRQGDNGPFVSMPAFKNKDGEFKEVCHPTTKEFREALSATVLDAYNRDSKWAVRDGVTRPNVDVNMSKFEKDGIKAIGSIVLDNEFCVNNITVRENKNGNLMVNMPSTSYDKDGTKAYKDICAPTGDYAEKGTIVGRIINVAKERLAEKEPLAAKVASAEETKKTQEKKTEEKKAPEKKTGAKSSKKKAKTEKEDRE